MSIKSQRPVVASDRPYIEKMRHPNYMANKPEKVETESIDNMSRYIKGNLKQAKPRGGEHR